MMGYPTTPTRSTAGRAGVTERVERLTGDRGKDDSGQAVTRSAAADLGTIVLKSASVSAAPTAAEHNALVEDMRMLAAVLNRMGAKIAGM